MWPGLQKSAIWMQKVPIFLHLLYHNVLTIYTNATIYLSMLQNLMGFLLQFTEMGYYI